MHHQMYPQVQKCINNSSNGGYDAGLEGTLHGGVNIALEGTP